ncbi:MAG TPA: hypothetical protein VFG83_14395, partial [Kofleriaceae bacterium]|nr:hypothetical protein [Kofleriaceae bacterium]
ELFGLVCDDNKRTVTIAQLIENCPDVAPFREDTYRPDPPCLLLSTTSEKIEVESHLRPNWLFWETMGGAVVAVAIFGVVLGLVDPEPGGT